MVKKQKRVVWRTIIRSVLPQTNQGSVLGPLWPCLFGGVAIAFIKHSLCRIVFDLAAAEEEH